MANDKKETTATYASIKFSNIKIPESNKVPKIKLAKCTKCDKWLDMIDTFYGEEYCIECR